jgi:Rne/Rng family ribonuclease
MAKELFVSSTPHETKVAIVEDDQLSEIYYERENEYTLAGSIYKGRVTRVLPGMQSAFVNVGLERDAFLYVSDFLMEEDEDADAIGEAVSRSRNETAVIEVPSADGAQEPIEAEHVLPPAEDGEETAEAEGEHAESGGRQEPEREGARRWRGRRRRGRGGRDRFADRTAGDRGGDRSEKNILKPSQPKTKAKPGRKFTLNTRLNISLKVGPSRERSIRVQNNPDQNIDQIIDRNIRVVSILALSTRAQSTSGPNLCCYRANRFLNTSRTLLSRRP